MPGGRNGLWHVGVIYPRALRAYSGKGHLQTLEGWEPLYAPSAAMLKEHYGDLVTCNLGDTRERLAQIAESGNPISFMFHDAGHSRDDYIRDFKAVKASLGQGTVVLIDDIRYEDLRISQGQPLQCYEGWREVCADPRVVRAAEIDGNLGLILIE